MNKRWEVSESLWLAILLSLSGGLMDAYSYLQRGHVFANAQTGNILLFSVNLSTGNFAAALSYIVPVAAFAAGLALASLLRLHYKNRPRVHWRQIVVLLEAVVFMFVAFIPQSFNLWANSLISLACGAQVESFRSIRNHETGYATTMCIGNLRAGVQSICEFWVTKRKSTLEQGLIAFGVILAFAFGAISGNGLVQLWGEKAILVSGGVMVIAFFAMLSRKKQS